MSEQWKSWRPWFADAADKRKADARRPAGFYMTDDGPKPLVAPYWVSDGYRWDRA